MARAPSNTDFVVPVDGIGNFTFGKRRMADELSIQREYASILQGVEPTDWLQTMAGWFSVLRTLTVRGPDGWDLEALDPLDEDTYAKLHKVYTALRDQERSFRSAPGGAGEAVRPDSV